ncbi:MAG: hypothetical protein KKA05_00030 [Alphaproteobacteria bacterium]|nr:hypothetical protein [Alphaproteobacteria bacterium]
MNDQSELTYSLEAILRAATTITVESIPRDLRNHLPNDHVHGLMPGYIHAIREHTRQNDYDRLYVASFAQGRNSREIDDGILTLWDRYTISHNAPIMRGYCLQYSRESIEQLIHSERHFYSYGMLELLDVQYGINENDPEFLYLAQQIAMWLLLELTRSTGDPRFVENFSEVRHSESYVISRLLRFCGTHKHPSFDDEREVRIFAMPSNQVIPVLFRPTLPKPVCRGTRTDSRFIELGANRSPALRPNRIVIGPNAELSVADVESLFPWTGHENTPIIIRSSIPIR